MVGVIVGVSVGVAVVGAAVVVGVAVVGVAIVGMAVGCDIGDLVCKPRNNPILCNVDLSEEAGSGNFAAVDAFDAAESIADTDSLRRNVKLPPPPDGANSSTKTVSGITDARKTFNIFCLCSSRCFCCLSSA